MIATGPYGAALTAIQNNGADVALLAEPIFTLHKGQYRALAWARDVFPPLLSTVGVAAAKTIKERPEALRAILVAHRKAVAFLEFEPKEFGGDHSQGLQTRPRQPSRRFSATSSTIPPRVTFPISARAIFSPLASTI